MLIDSLMDDFRLAAPDDVQALLQQVAEARTLLNLTAPGGVSYTTTLLTVDGARSRISLGADPDHPQLQGLLEAGEVTAMGYHDAVKLQFDLHDLVLVRGHRSCGLQADMPGVVFRFQRRLSFRVRTLPRSSPLVRLCHPSLPDMQLELRVLDISMGGCALLLPDNVPPLPAGVSLKHTQVELDADTRFHATLQLEHVTSLSAGAFGVRLGCSMHDLSGEGERVLQHYIDQTQKRRRLLELDSE